MVLEKINFKLFTSTLVVCTTMILVFGTENPMLGYNSVEFHGWQLITAHFVHYDVKHLITNMLALGLLMYIFPTTFKSHLKAMAVAIILIDIYLCFSDVKYYIGYSGLLYVIPGLACMGFIQGGKYNHALAIIIILIFYISVLATEMNLSSNLQWQSLKQAHFLGFLGGFLSKTKILNSLLQKLMSITIDLKE